MWAYGKELGEQRAPGSNVWAAFQWQQLMLEHKEEEPARQRKVTKQSREGTQHSHGCRVCELSQGHGNSLYAQTIAPGQVGLRPRKGKCQVFVSSFSFFPIPFLRVGTVTLSPTFSFLKGE
jgi:hypothetical protein